MKVRSYQRFFALIFSGLAVIVFLLAGCNTPAENTPPGPPKPEIQMSAEQAIDQLTVMTHDSFAISEEILKEFETQNHIEVRFLKSGDTGTALNKAILAKDNPLADVFYGVDNTFLSRAVAEGIFDSYVSPLLASIPDLFELDPNHGALPVDYGDVCLNYDVAFLKERGIEPPQSLEDSDSPRIQEPACRPKSGNILAGARISADDHWLLW